MVLVWKEYDVIVKMVENILVMMEYMCFIIFVGVYCNDVEIIIEVECMVCCYLGCVVCVVVMYDGLMCKVDCLNIIIQIIIWYEVGYGICFVGVIMYDCEDVIYLLELKYFNYFICDQDFVQLLVLLFECKWYEWVVGMYMDDFFEMYQKDLVVCQVLIGMVFGVGVVLCYSCCVIEVVMKVCGDFLFNISMFIEDYDFSFWLCELGMCEVFVYFLICENVELIEDVQGKIRICWCFGWCKGVCL